MHLTSVEPPTNVALCSCELGALPSGEMYSSGMWRMNSVFSDAGNPLSSCRDRAEEVQKGRANEGNF